VTGDAGQNAQLSSNSVQQALRRRLTDVRNQSAQPARVLEAICEIPYYAHATMEPMNCVADVHPDRCDVWAPTQAPQGAQAAASRITGLPPEVVSVHVTLMGMGLGRRSAEQF
jgi:isoquinoline 1-oxidoreductase beta subunit